MKDEGEYKKTYNTNMSIVSNFIGGIGGINPNGGINGIAPQFDLNDTTFAELLEKQLNAQEESKGVNSLLGALGMPPGMQIDGMDGAEFTETAFDQAEALGAKTDTEKREDVQNDNLIDLNNDGEISTQEVRTFFSSLLDNGTTGQEARSELFDFAKKQAASFYNKYSKDVITNLNEFVDDLREKIS